MPKVLSPSDKFQPRNVGELLHPGSCMSCGSGTCQEGYVDLSTYFDYEGQMYLCSFCLQEAAEVLGCLTISESKHLQETNEKLAADNTLLVKELKNATERLDAYDSVMRSITPALTVHSPSINLEVDTELPIFNAGSSGSSDSGESESKEPVTIAGRNDSSLPERSNVKSDGIDL